jgi:hypothetical protein
VDITNNVSVRDFRITCNLGDVDVSDIDTCRKRCFEIIEHEDFANLVGNFQVQARQLAAGSKPRGEAEVKCTVDGKGNVSCTGGVKWSF